MSARPNRTPTTGWGFAAAMTCAVLLVSDSARWSTDSW
jgi:hypothetical protein